jgi:hypothetical protein
MNKDEAMCLGQLKVEGTGALGMPRTAVEEPKTRTSSTGKRDRTRMPRPLLQQEQKNRAIGAEQFQGKRGRNKIAKDSSTRIKGQSHGCRDGLREEGQDQGVTP